MDLARLSKVSMIFPCIIPSIIFFFDRKIHPGKETPVQVSVRIENIFSKSTGKPPRSRFQALLFPSLLHRRQAPDILFLQIIGNGSFSRTYSAGKTYNHHLYSFQTCLFKIAGSKISVSLYFNSYQFSPYSAPPKAVPSVVWHSPYFLLIWSLPFPIHRDEFE